MEGRERPEDDTASRVEEEEAAREEIEGLLERHAWVSLRELNDTEVEILRSNEAIDLISEETLY